MILLDLFGLYSKVSSKSLGECEEFTVELDHAETLDAVIAKIKSGDDKRKYYREIEMVREEDSSKLIEGQYHNLRLKSIYYWLFWYSFELKLTRVDGSISINGTIHPYFSPWSPSVMNKIWCTFLGVVWSYFTLTIALTDSSFSSVSERIGFILFGLLGIGFLLLSCWMIDWFLEVYLKIQVKILVSEMIKDLKQPIERC